MAGSERAEWTALYELEHAERTEQTGQKPATPHRTRTFSRRGGRRR